MASAKYDFEFTGRIVEIQPTQTFASGFKKRTVIIDDKGEDAEYPNPVPFQLTKDRCADADKFHHGQLVTVKGWFNGRKWHNESKNCDQYFCDMMIGKFESDEVSSPTEVPEPAQAPDIPSETQASEPSSMDLPF